MGLFIRATKRVDDKIYYAFIPSSLPSEEDEVIDGNDNTGILEGNSG
ncbi:hypothetical protein SEA_OHMYWARD_2 [Gordonia phage OhMyWard]|uniref:Uncharacterized protein n=1 Tax=Gordonia phage OhMyWard TaxID=2652414 RepID=A0A5P8D776_9CAUD|nr:hypothetical protein HWC72_gp02 [Gordonia phage OhMyWard]QFP94884.1 hypothetical protein SEA_OHMYWARD_2 [Gordonia phage OhMyWard]